VVQKIPHLMLWRQPSLMVLLTEACMALTERVMAPLFWTTFISQPSNASSTSPSTSHYSEITESVPMFVLEEKHNMA